MRTPSILDALTSEWLARGWSLDDLHGFRMEGDDLDALAELDDDDRAALEALTDDERSALAELSGGGDPDPTLGPKGERALAAEKDKRRAAQAELREWKALGLKPADIKKILDDRKGAADKPDPELIRSEAKAEAQAELMQSRVLDKIEAKAARLFADPDDAAALLMKDHDADDFLDDGKIDVEAIQDALKVLLEKKPYLAAAQGGKKFQGGADGGPRNDSRPRQLTRDDLKTMTPAQIEKAQTDGQLDDLLQGKTT